MRDNNEWSLEEFLRRKAKEKAGGRFYAVFNGSIKVGTEWGRYEADLHNHLNHEGIKFTRVVPLA